MTIVIIPGFIGHPDEFTFKDLEKNLTLKGHSVIKIAWPYFPTDLSKYNFSNTLAYAKKIVEKVNNQELVILGFSMGGIIATQLAAEFQPKKLGLIVSPYQAGTEDDLAGKYKEWKEKGYRQLTSSKYGSLKIPFSFLEDAKKFNALNVIPLVKSEILFIVGEKDEKILFGASRKLFDAAPKPNKWYLIPNMEHKYQYQPEMLKKVNQIIENFVSGS